MNFVKLACVTLAAATFCGAANAQRLDDHGMSERARVAQLTQPWYETEGDWQGVWTPANPTARDGAYNATWTKGRDREHASLLIHWQDLAVTITRTQANGSRCDYQGYLNAARNVVTGTFHCDWAPRPMPWRASIGARIAPSQVGDLPVATQIPAYLHFPWAETEGGWHGRWTPRNPDAEDGVYDATWVMGNAHAAAELQISVDNAAGTITVLRTDPGGRRCTYHGVISNNTILNVSGTYRCGADRTLLTWHASLQVPRNP